VRPAGLIDDLKSGAADKTLSRPNGFKADAKILKMSSMSAGEYKVRMREMMKKYTDAEVLESLRTLPISTYFEKFG